MLEHGTLLSLAFTKSLRARSGKGGLPPCSIEAIQSELRALPVEERRKLMAFMVVLEDEGRADYAAKLAQRIDDRSPDRWLSPEQCERELGLSDEPK